MPWFPVDTHWYLDPKVQAAGEATPFAFSVFPVLLAQAKQRADGGRVEIIYRHLAYELFMETEQLAKTVAALVDVGLLELESRNGVSAAVRFPPATWRRWNETFRKSAKRAEKKA